MSIPIRRVTEGHGPDSEFIRRLSHAFCAAREERLQFLMAIHDVEEDRRFLSGVVLPTHQVWVAEADEGIVGFIAVADNWVNHLYVIPGFQRRGLGRRFLDIAKKSGAALQLWVFEINTPAIRFYEREGFRIVRRTDGADNEAKMPDVLMEWNAAAAI